MRWPFAIEVLRRELIPRARVITLVPLFPFFQVMALPAIAVLGLWFVFQFFSGALTFRTSAVTGGVAFWAHVGGFAFGALVMWISGGGRGGLDSARSRT